MESNETSPPDHLPASVDGYETQEECLVKERCFDQREALPGEPCCVVCGRYGEYICDQTDDDVCSVECKGIVLSRHAESKRPALPAAKPVDIPVRDECFYVTDDKCPDLQGLRNDQIVSLRSKMDISVKGQAIPDPILSFSSCGLPEKLERNLETAGYVIPTPVQMQSIPAALGGRNLLVSADTGSGKTAAFLVPIITHCLRARLQNSVDRKKPLAMVLTPTRELCVQVEEEAKVLGKGLPFKTALVVGGEALAGQVYRIQNGVELVVGTPGRLIDLLAKNDTDLDEVSVLVLDEVDCLLQKGFRDPVMQIFRALSRPQVLMFSATISQAVEWMASLMGSDLLFISCGFPSKPNRSVNQIVIWVESKHKKQKIFDIFKSKQHFKPPTIVFIGSRLGADLLSEAITAAIGFKALSIHGEKTMAERKESLKMFLMGEVPILVSTGILGRGVDLLKVRQVIIFDMPKCMEEYIHQVGRASRLGEEGMAIVFVNEEDKKLFKELAQNLKSAGAAIPRELANSRYLVGSYSSTGGKKRKFGR